MPDTTGPQPTGKQSAAELVVDFVNSYEPQVDEEKWHDPAGLGQWLHARRLTSSDVALRPSDLRTARTVREGLRAVLAGHAGHDSDKQAVDAMNQALAGLTVSVLVGDDGLRLTSPSSSPIDAALAQVLDAVHECTLSGAWPRLKVCARDSCRWAFYDASRNQVRRWCSMAGCGNHIKMQRAYTAKKIRGGRATDASAVSSRQPPVDLTANRPAP